MNELRMTKDATLLQYRIADICKSEGPGEVHLVFTRLLADIYAGTIYKLRTAALREGYPPQERKALVVMAIHKDDWRPEFGNTWPMGLESILCKVPERILREHLSALDAVLCVAFRITWISKT